MGGLSDPRTTGRETFPQISKGVARNLKSEVRSKTNRFSVLHAWGRLARSRRMSKQAATPRTARRPRTAAGATPPHIAHLVARTHFTGRALITWLSCCGDVTSRTVGAALSEAFRLAPTTVHRDIVIDALCDLSETHLNSCPDVGPDAAGAAADLATEVAGQVTAIRAYLEEAWSSVTKPEELAGTIEAAVGDGFDGELLCWDIIGVESLNHIGLIRKEASKLLRKLPERSTDELMGYGWTGLRIALRQFDPALGFSFSTYACPRINGAIRDGVRSENPLPKRLTTVARAAAAAEEKLTHELQRTPSYSEVAAALESFDAKQTNVLPRLAPAASLEELTHAWGEKSREPSCLVDSCDPADEADRLLRVTAVRDAVKELPADEAAAIQLLCLEERTLSEAAGLLGVETRVLRAAKRRGMTALANKLEQHAPA